MRCTRKVWTRAAGTTACSLVFCATAAAAATRSVDAAAAGSTNSSSIAMVDAKPSTAFATDSTGRVAPWQSFTVETGDSLSRLFARAGLRAGQAAVVIAAGADAAALKQLQVGKTLTLRKTTDGRLSGLRYALDALDTLSVTRDPKNDALNAEIVRRKPNRRRLTASGTVDGSLSRSLTLAGVPASIATKLSDIYRYRADLSKNVQPGARFAVIYDADFVDGKRVSTGPVIAASIVTDGRTLEAFRARSDDGKFGYYDAQGKPYEPAFSRRPVDYERISSPFNLHRMNPVLHIVRPHYGVDMAAPAGTPIHAAARGRVKFEGRKQGYGRLVELLHSGGYSTRYAHMARIASGLEDGEKVRKGQVIGYVGSSGITTGPHVHFEIRKDGVAHDPLTMTLPAGKPLPPTRLAAFKSRIHPLVATLDDLPGMSNSVTVANAGLSAQPGCSRASAVSAVLALSPSRATDHHALSDLFCVVAVADNA